MSQSPSEVPAIVAGQHRPPLGRRRIAIAAIGTILVAGARLAGLAFAPALIVFWVIALLAMFAPWLWRTLTYRVGVRLLVSYVLIGVVPIPLLALLATMVGYMVIGQYTAIRFAGREARLLSELDQLAERALAGNPSEVLAATRLHPPEGIPGIEFVVVEGDLATASTGLQALPTPGFTGTNWPSGGWTGVIAAPGQVFLAAVRGGHERSVVVLVALDESTAAALSASQWYTVRFGFTAANSSVSREDSGFTMNLGSRPQRGQGSAAEAEITYAGSPVTLTAAPPPAPSVPRRWVAWIQPLAKAIAWETGGPAESSSTLVVLSTSPSEAWADFTAGPRDIARALSGATVAVSIVLGVVYLLAVALAAGQILSITRATARLSRGTAAVAGGDLDYRIPARRHDQLGDLAVAFNSMTASVAAMLHQVADQARMKREMELAREIQQSLLPETSVTCGRLVIHAHFRPASEVGGDYFDVFRLGDGAAIVTVGDVAGHGLPTGLMMAMVKSALGALIQEGYRGAELVERLNRLLLQQTIRQRMATLVLAEIDAGRRTLRLTSCGHPPAFVVAPSGVVAEIALSSLPLGTRLAVGPAHAEVAFPPGSLLLLYSDGLVEATDAAGCAFGYERLEGVTRAAAATGAKGLVDAILVALDGHVGGVPLADDLTVLVVEHRRFGDESAQQREDCERDQARE